MNIRALATCTALLSLAIAAPVNASLTLTPQGISDGFTLSTFLSGYTPSTYGPLAQGVLNGKVIAPSAFTGGSFTGTVYVFNDVDNQTLSDAITSSPYTAQTGNPQFAMTTAGGQVYGAQAFGGVYEHFSSNGTFTPIPNLQSDGLTSFLGMWTDPVNQHIISASEMGLVDIDPVAGTFKVIVPGLFPDGVSVSPNGQVAYVAISNGIGAYSISTGASLNFWGVGHGTDGTGVITGGKFNGDIVVNNNDGTVGLLDPTNGNYSTIADSGTRGDWVSLDTNNGSLFLSQTEQIDRLTCDNCTFGTIPEPASFDLLGAGILCAAGALGRKFLM